MHLVADQQAAPAQVDLAIVAEMPIGQDGAERIIDRQTANTVKTHGWPPDLFEPLRKFWGSADEAYARVTAQIRQVRGSAGGSVSACTPQATADRALRPGAASIAPASRKRRRRIRSTNAIAWSAPSVW